MKFWKDSRFWLIVIGFSAISQLYAPFVWISNDVRAQPIGIQVPFFLFLTLFESIAFGIAVGTLFFIFQELKKLPKDLRHRFTRIFVALGWTLGSRWPHDNFYRVTGEDLTKILIIEYVFQFTLIIAALVMLFDLVYLISHLRQKP